LNTLSNLEHTNSLFTLFLGLTLPPTMYNKFVPEVVASNA